VAIALLAAEIIIVVAPVSLKVQSCLSVLSTASGRPCVSQLLFGRGDRLREEVEQIVGDGEKQ
jgi:hypothetical protein